MAVTISEEAVSNRDWKVQFQFTDDDETSPTYGQLIDFTGAVIAFAIEDGNGCQMITAGTADGKIVVISSGVIELTIEASEMNLCAGTYNIGGYFQLNGETIDLLEGSISVRRGFPKP
jgi:hypothetical protein